MAKNQKKYTEEFRMQIVDLHIEAGKTITELSNEYGVSKGTISSWIKKYSPVQISETETITRKEFEALQKENRALKIELEILKKATAIFAREI